MTPSRERLSLTTIFPIGPPLVGSALAVVRPACTRIFPSHADARTSVHLGEVLVQHPAGREPRPDGPHRGRHAVDPLPRDPIAAASVEHRGHLAFEEVVQRGGVASVLLLGLGGPPPDPPPPSPPPTPPPPPPPPPP